MVHFNKDLRRPASKVRRVLRSIVNNQEDDISLRYYAALLSSEQSQGNIFFKLQNYQIVGKFSRTIFFILYLSYTYIGTLDLGSARSFLPVKRASIGEIETVKRCRLSCNQHYDVIYLFGNLPDNKYFLSGLRTYRFLYFREFC